MSRGSIVVACWRSKLSTIVTSALIGGSCLSYGPRGRTWAAARDDDETKISTDSADEMPDDDAKDAAKDTKKSKTKSKVSNSKTAKAKSKTPAKKPATVPLRYGFKEGEKYVYEVEIVMDFGDSVRTVSGNSAYTVKRADDDEMVLEHDGRLITHTQSRGGQPRFDPRHRHPASSFPGSFGGKGELSISPSGEAAKNTSVGQLPFLLGPLSMLIIEPLSPDNESKWERSLDLSVANKPAASNSGPGRGSAASRARTKMSRGRAEQPEPPTFVSAAFQKAEYTRGAAKGDLIKISKHLELKSPGGGEVPAMEKVSEGEITFDTKAGVPKKAMIKEQLGISVNNATVTVPMTLSYRLLSAAEVAKLDKQAADQKDASEARAAEANRPLEAKDVRQLLADIKLPDKRRAAMDRLAKGPANDMRPQVSKALDTLLKDQETRKLAVIALGVWGTKDNVPALVALLDDKDGFLKSDVMKTLGKLNDERGAEAIAKHLYADRGNASEALRAMGPMAEPYVVPLLQDREEGVRAEACKILAAIGTEQSRAALESLAKDGKGFDAREAEKAIKQIAARP